MINIYKLRYYPSFKSENNIVVGVIIYDELLDKLYFKRKYNIYELKEMDKEININLFKSNVLGIEKEVEKLNICELDQYVKKYVNEYKFDKI